MTTITISRRARSVHALLQRARRENVILRSPEGEEFILAEVEDFNREIELARQNRALMKFLEARARQTETFSLEEAKNLLGLAQACPTRPANTASRPRS
jgi:hypothetical protein